jgi:hypothetical protein
MKYDAIVGGVQSPDTVMVFGTCELTSTQLQTGGRADLLDLLMRNGVKRFAAERILEIHCTAGPSAGRARAHATSRSASLR